MRDGAGKAIRRGGCVAALLLLTPGAAAEQPALYPAAQCAAFWLGRDDHARVSAFLDRDPEDPARAAGFRAAAIRLNAGGAGAVDAFIAAERPAMARLVGYVILGDRISTDLHDRLLQTCETFARTQPETSGPP